MLAGRLGLVALLAGCPGAPVERDTGPGPGEPCKERRWFEDADGDGYGNGLAVQRACEPPQGFVDNALDCDDTDDAVHPGAEELCNGIDDDCDGDTDEDLQDFPWHRDGDGDGFGLEDDVVEDCAAPPGYAAEGRDCDDTDPSTYPGAPEFCAGADLDCNGQVAAAAIGSTEYATIQGAIDVAFPEDTVYVCPGVHDVSLEIGAGRVLTLEGWTGDPDDAVLDGKRKRRILSIGDFAAVELRSLRFEDGAADAPEEAGGAILAAPSYLEVTDCVFARNRAAVRGGAIDFDGYSAEPGSYSLRIDSCTFQENAATERGGALELRAYQDSWVEVLDCAFVDNNSGLYGGAIHIDSYRDEGLSLTVTTSTFESNLSEDGGAIYIDAMSPFFCEEENEVKILGSTFTENGARHNGGAIFTSVQGLSFLLEVDDSTFDGNRAGHSGGSLQFDGPASTTPKLLLDGCVFVDGLAGYGGALSFGSGDDPEITILDTSFQGNIAGGFGGAVEASVWGKGTFSASDTVFEDNEGGAGGAVYFGRAFESTDITLEDVTFDGNQSYDEGGAILFSYAAVACILVSGGSFTSNIARGVGGAVSASDDTVLESDDVDWGSGSTDNSPDDLSGWGESYSDLGAAESFSCDADGCDL